MMVGERTLGAARNRTRIDSESSLVVGVKCVMYWIFVGGYSKGRAREIENNV